MPDRPLATLAYQVDELQKTTEHLDGSIDALTGTVEKLSRTVAIHDEQISGAGGLIKAMEKLGQKVDGLNKALWAFACSFIAAAITIAIAVGGSVH